MEKYVAITFKGPPDSGKSKAMKIVTAALEAKGWKVITSTDGVRKIIAINRQGS